MALTAHPATARAMDTAWEMGHGALMGAETPSAKHVSFIFFISFMTFF